MAKRLLLPLLLIVTIPLWITEASAQLVDRPTLVTNTPLVAELFPPAKPYTLLTVVVDAANTRVLVQYSVSGNNARRLARFSLDGDRSVNYKMGMLMLLREALRNPDLQVFLSFTPETADSSFPVIGSVAVRPAP